ncbi:hypothetical protein BCR44DRAFT_184394 [Catenaria anguillulae PL171]|uniref:WD40-repeat-containing domain protein n=1 Tax=Catenaria anguillulae PL171 TaxID=765915 RepID=A0A1Y2H431_9FUNG|nr:hypothetical protein BCR44DRAFT_184394 [Catenaria anguillulae PL171]
MASGSWTRQMASDGVLSSPLRFALRPPAGSTSSSTNPTMETLTLNQTTIPSRWNLYHQTMSPSNSQTCTIVAIANSDTSIKLVCVSMNGKCVQFSLPRLSPTNSNLMIQRLCASTSALVALLADKGDASRQSLICVPVPTSLFTYLSGDEYTKPLPKWERKLAHIGDPTRGQVVTKASQPPIMPTASNWDTSREFAIPSRFGTIVQVVYSAQTHPLAILRTSNRKYSPLVLVRVDRPDTPVVGTINVACPQLVASLPKGRKPGSMTAFAHVSGLDERFLRPMPAFPMMGSTTGSVHAHATSTSELATLVLAVGDSRGNVHVYRVLAPRPSPSPSCSVPCPDEYEVEHFASLVGVGGDGNVAAIRSVHVNAGVVVAADVNGQVRVWEPLSGKCLRRFRFACGKGEAEQVSHITSWPEAPDRIAFVLESGKVKVLDVLDPDDWIPRFSTKCFTWDD